MIMKKIVIFFVLTLTFSQTISATVISVPKARNLASAFFTEKGKMQPHYSLSNSPPSLIMDSQSTTYLAG